jgi:hypothetical protein
VGKTKVDGVRFLESVRSRVGWRVVFAVRQWQLWSCCPSGFRNSKAVGKTKEAGAIEHSGGANIV